MTAALWLIGGVALFALLVFNRLTAADAVAEPQMCTRLGLCILDHAPCNGWPRVDSEDDYHARRQAVGAEPGAD